MMLKASLLVLVTTLLTAGLVAGQDESPLGALPDDFSVYAVGVYQGKTPVNIKLDDGGHQTTQVEVVVNKPGKPVVLVLTAYDPVVWRVGRTKDTTIAGIIVSGYHGQALIGVDKATPHAISTYMKKGKFNYFMAFGASKRLLAMNERVKEHVGREIDHFYFRIRDGGIHVGDKPREAGDVIYSADLKLPDKPKSKQPVVGQKAVDQLVNEKKLRLATRADIEAWIDEASKPYKRFNPDLRVQSRMRVGRTYVVLDEFTLPNGLYGAHSRSFIIPRGVKIPRGPRCHNTFYLMDGTATGAGAYSE